MDVMTCLRVYELSNCDGLQYFITVEGLANQSNLTKLKLYTIHGKEVISATLNTTNNKQIISTQGLRAGIYIVKLESGNILLTKKLFIK